MQVNEQAGQVQRGKRPLDVDRTFHDTHLKSKPQAKRPGADESRRPAARTQTRGPVSYGAGF